LTSSGRSSGKASGGHKLLGLTLIRSYDSNKSRGSSLRHPTCLPKLTEAPGQA
jgi:hypothetical protein